tara:strand:- start:2230 stop:3483 length:1254 start_codon:yes stop_codon:yes gene_type:complete
MADLQGLLGGSLLPEQTRQGSYRDTMLGSIASTGAGMRRGLGRAVGMDTRTDGERAKEELGKLDPTNPADQEKIIALVAPINPQKAMEMRQQFSAEKAVKDLELAKADRLHSKRQAIVGQLSKNPQYADMVPLVEAGVFDAGGSFKDVLPLLKKTPPKGWSYIKPYAGTLPDGTSAMLTVASKEGEDDRIIDLNTMKKPPKGTVLRDSKGTEVNIDMGADADAEFIKYLGRGRAEIMRDSYEEATQSVLNSSVIQEQWETINSAEGIFTGMGAEGIQLPLAKLLMKGGFISKDSEKMIENTEAFIANAGNMVAEVIKAFGAGTGLSDADREFAKGIVGGTVALTEASLKRLVKLQARATMRKIEMHNKKAENLPEAVQGWGFSVAVPDMSWAFEDAPEKSPTPSIPADIQVILDQYL